MVKNSLFVLLSISQSLLAAEGTPDFARDVRPILSSHCFKCHGQDEGSRKGGLRLDSREAALAAGKSGELGVVPGNSAASEIIERIFSSAEDDVMPPPSAKHPLTQAQKDILRRWVDGGAAYAEHWAFVAPKTVTPPAIKQADWPVNAIDRFVLANLEKEGLTPSPHADKLALLRRVSLDLIGLPPSEEEIATFLADDSAEAYDKLVTRLLASPHYGERWARRWMDLARYADSNGYEKDRARPMWPWRDWLIRSLNADMPYDQFTIAQLAGDMLPQATEEQVLATGFHRNTMLNEEGGIDPLEFRFHAMTDRVATTGSTWLGLTTGCAQCHTHKYDPILHTEYFQLMAFLNNTEEPTHFLTVNETAEQKANRLREADQLEARLPELWKALEDDQDYLPVLITGFVNEGKGKYELKPPNVVSLTEQPSPVETHTIHFQTEEPLISEIRIEALTQGKKGPGGTPHGNFVLTEVRLAVENNGSETPLRLSSGHSQTVQPSFDPNQALDGDSKTGWAVDTAGQDLKQDKSVVFKLEKPLPNKPGNRFTLTLEQQYGGKHVLRKIRLSVPRTSNAEAPKQRPYDAAYDAWLSMVKQTAADWTTPEPKQLKANGPQLRWEPAAACILARGDFTKEDHYELHYADVPAGTQSIRLTALPSPDLPGDGPGMTYYEGRRGAYFIGDLSLSTGKIARVITTEGSGDGMIDDNLQSGWEGAGPGKRSAAIFQLESPHPGGPLTIRFQSGRHYAASLAKFSVSFTASKDLPKVLDFPNAVELAVRQGSEPAELRRLFHEQAKELAGPLEQIRQLRLAPRGQETLVMRERPTDLPRTTHRHHRGEYLSPEETVEPGVPAFLPPLPPNTPKNRLGFAKWLMTPQHPLTARVAVNRAWAAFFGQGLVRTLGDFGFQGELPSHPELLDWLALEFSNKGWSMKELHRWIVLSATYRQSSATRPELLAKDPQNRLLARGPRFRVEAEMVRDIQLQASGLLTTKLYGPPVRPPQPASVTEAAYGDNNWVVSSGADRYRRAIYTFTKRGAPFAATNTFDAPTGEACIPRRDLSNTPLQSLTLLNDEAFVEMAQALGNVISSGPEDDTGKLQRLYHRVLTRPAKPAEATRLLALLEKTRQRLRSHELDAAAISPAGEGSAEQRAAWTVLARAVLNLDETITKS
jgi:hypothetical protein